MSNQENTPLPSSADDAFKADQADISFFFDDELAEFDPLASEDEEDASTPKRPGQDRERAAQGAWAQHAKLPPEERIIKLIESMNVQGKILRATIAFCEEPHPVADVTAYISELQRDAFSVFDGPSITQMLARDGALERVNEAGEPLDDSSNEPEIIEVEGVGFYRVTEPEASFWVSTEAGRAVVAMNDPRARLKLQLEKDASYVHVFRTILELCAAEGGSTPAALGEAVDDDPVLEEPRRYAGYFIEKLDHCEAIEWHDGAWRITPIGDEYLRSER